MSTTTVKATDLTCQHCALSVQEEVQEIPNVSAVEVEVAKGGESTITITHQGPLDPQAVSAAIQEAGYTPAN